jgi:hypothetical protein
MAKLTIHSYRTSLFLISQITLCSFFRVLFYRDSFFCLFPYSQLKNALKPVLLLNLLTLMFILFHFYPKGGF